MDTVTTMTIQEQLKAELEKAGLPYKEIQVYGSQIVITSWSRDAAVRWSSLLSRFAKIRGTVKSVDYTEDTTYQRKLHPGYVVQDSFFKHEVWRTFATI